MMPLIRYHMMAIPPPWRADRPFGPRLGYASIRYSEQLAEAGIEPYVGSVGDGYNDAHAQAIYAIYEAKIIYRRGLWRNVETVTFAMLEWVPLMKEFGSPTLELNLFHVSILPQEWGEKVYVASA
ncbi:hypothetical protein HRR99_07335 [Agrobacterium vaccinii]|nr:hypothetical protein HRR99_07335 [Agrobacterium vaccinii]